MPDGSPILIPAPPPPPEQPWKKHHVEISLSKEQMQELLSKLKQM
jgi:hypothetical protein